MTDILTARILNPDGSIQGGLFRASINPPWELTFSGAGLVEQVFQGSDLFEALVALRVQLEIKGCRLLCAGARRDVCPSGMSRSMGGGRKAYVFQLGKSAKELIDIFEDARPNQVVTVKEQFLFRQEWVKSLREKII